MPRRYKLTPTRMAALINGLYAVADLQQDPALEGKLVTAFAGPPFDRGVADAALKAGLAPLEVPVPGIFASITAEGAYEINAEGTVSISKTQVASVMRNVVDKPAAGVDAQVLNLARCVLLDDEPAGLEETDFTDDIDNSEVENRLLRAIGRGVARERLVDIFGDEQVFRASLRAAVGRNLGAIDANIANRLLTGGFNLADLVADDAGANQKARVLSKVAEVIGLGHVAELRAFYGDDAGLRGVLTGCDAANLPALLQHLSAADIHITNVSQDPNDRNTQAQVLSQVAGRVAAGGLDAMSAFFGGRGGLWDVLMGCSNSVVLGNLLINLHDNVNLGICINDIDANSIRREEFLLQAIRLGVPRAQLETFCTPVPPPVIALGALNPFQTVLSEAFRDNLITPQVAVALVAQHPANHAEDFHLADFDDPAHPDLKAQVLSKVVFELLNAAALPLAPVPVNVDGLRVFCGNAAGLYDVLMHCDNADLLLLLQRLALAGIRLEHVGDQAARLQVLSRIANVATINRGDLLAFCGGANPINRAAVLRAALTADHLVPYGALTQPLLVALTARGVHITDISVDQVEQGQFLLQAIRAGANREQLLAFCGDNVGVLQTALHAVVDGHLDRITQPVANRLIDLDMNFHLADFGGDDAFRAQVLNRVLEVVTQLNRGKLMHFYGDAEYLRTVLMGCINNVPDSYLTNLVGQLYAVGVRITDIGDAARQQEFLLHAIQLGVPRARLVNFCDGELPLQTAFRALAANPALITQQVAQALIVGPNGAAFRLADFADPADRANQAQVLSTIAQHVPGANHACLMAFCRNVGDVDDANAGTNLLGILTQCPRDVLGALLTDLHNAGIDISDIGVALAAGYADRQAFLLHAIDQGVGRDVLVNFCGGESLFRILLQAAVTTSPDFATPQIVAVLTTTHEGAPNQDFHLADFGDAAHQALVLSAVAQNVEGRNKARRIQIFCGDDARGTNARVNLQATLMACPNDDGLFQLTTLLNNLARAGVQLKYVGHKDIAGQEARRNFLLHAIGSHTDITGAPIEFVARGVNKAALEAFCGGENQCKKLIVEVLGEHPNYSRFTGDILKGLVEGGFHITDIIPSSNWPEFLKQAIRVGTVNDVAEFYLVSGGRSVESRYYTALNLALGSRYKDLTSSILQGMLDHHVTLDNVSNDQDNKNVFLLQAIAIVKVPEVTLAKLRDFCGGAPRFKAALRTALGEELPPAADQPRYRNLTAPVLRGLIRMGLHAEDIIADAGNAEQKAELVSAVKEIPGLTKEEKEQFTGPSAATKATTELTDERAAVVEQLKETLLKQKRVLGELKVEIDMLTGVRAGELRQKIVETGPVPGGKVPAGQTLPELQQRQVSKAENFARDTLIQQAGSPLGELKTKIEWQEQDIDRILGALEKDAATPVDLAEQNKAVETARSLITEALPLIHGVEVDLTKHAQNMDGIVKYSAQVAGNQALIQRTPVWQQYCIDKTITPNAHNPMTEHMEGIKTAQDTQYAQFEAKLRATTTRMKEIPSGDFFNSVRTAELGQQQYWSVCKYEKKIGLVEDATIKQRQEELYEVQKKLLQEQERILSNKDIPQEQRLAQLKPLVLEAFEIQRKQIWLATQQLGRVTGTQAAFQQENIKRQQEALEKQLNFIDKAQRELLVSVPANIDPVSEIKVQLAQAGTIGAVTREPILKYNDLLALYPADAPAAPDAHANSVGKLVRAINTLVTQDPDGASARGVVKQLGQLALVNPGFADPIFLAQLLGQAWSDNVKKYSIQSLIEDGHFTYTQLLATREGDVAAKRADLAAMLAPAIGADPTVPPVVQVPASVLAQAAMRDVARGEHDSFTNPEFIKVLLGLPPQPDGPVPERKYYTLQELIQGGFPKSALVAAYGSEQAFAAALTTGARDATGAPVPVPPEVIRAAAIHDPAYAEEGFVRALEAADPVLYPKDKVLGDKVLPLIFQGVQRERLVALCGGEEKFRKQLAQELTGKDNVDVGSSATAKILPAIKEDLKTHPEKARKFFECGLNHKDLNCVKGLYGVMAEAGVSRAEFTARGVPQERLIESLRSLTDDILRKGTISSDFKDSGGIEFLTREIEYNGRKRQLFNIADMVRIGCELDAVSQYHYGRSSLFGPPKTITAKELRDDFHLSVGDLQNADDSFRSSVGVVYLMTGRAYSLEEIVRIGVKVEHLPGAPDYKEVARNLALVQLKKVPASLLHDRGTKEISRSGGLLPIPADGTYIGPEFIKALLANHYTILELIQGGYTKAELEAPVGDPKKVKEEIATILRADPDKLTKELAESLIKAGFGTDLFAPGDEGGLGITPSKFKALGVSARYFHDYRQDVKPFHPFRKPEMVAQLMNPPGGYKVEEMAGGWYSASELLAAKDWASKKSEQGDESFDDFIKLITPEKLKEVYPFDELRVAYEKRPDKGEFEKGSDKSYSVKNVTDGDIPAKILAALTPQRDPKDPSKEIPLSLSEAKDLAKAMYGEAWDEASENWTFDVVAWQKLPRLRLDFTLPESTDTLKALKIPQKQPPATTPPTPPPPPIDFVPGKPIFGQLFEEDKDPTKKGEYKLIENIAILPAWKKWLKDKYNKVKGDPNKLEWFKKLKIADLDRLAEQSKKGDVEPELRRRLREGFSAAVDKEASQEAVTQLITAVELGVQRGWEKFSGVMDVCKSQAAGDVDSEEALEVFYGVVMQEIRQTSKEFSQAATDPGAAAMIRDRLLKRVGEAVDTANARLRENGKGREFLNKHKKDLQDAAVVLCTEVAAKQEALIKCKMTPEVYDALPGSQEEDKISKADADFITIQRIDRVAKERLEITEGRYPAEKSWRFNPFTKDKMFSYNKETGTITIPGTWGPFAKENAAKRAVAIAIKMGFKTTGVEYWGGEKNPKERLAILTAFADAGIHVKFTSTADKKYRAAEEALQLRFAEIRRKQQEVAEKGAGKDEVETFIDKANKIMHLGEGGLQQKQEAFDEMWGKYDGTRQLELAKKLKEIYDNDPNNGDIAKIIIMARTSSLAGTFTSNGIGLKTNYPKEGTPEKGWDRYVKLEKHYFLELAKTSYEVPRGEASLQVAGGAAKSVDKVSLREQMEVLRAKRGGKVGDEESFFGDRVVDKTKKEQVLAPKAISGEGTKAEKLTGDKPKSGDGGGVPPTSTTTTPHV